MIDKLNVSQCVLCKACSTACPTGAIRFDNGHCSFAYPTIDTDKCVGCNKCERVCPVLNDPVPRTEPPQAFAAQSRDEENRQNSTSGGLFRELAQAMLSQGGLVAGVVQNDDYTVTHILTADPAGVDAMRGSKYQQSETQGIYREVGTALKAGTPVLFTGTPCQSAALRSYLGKEYDGLIIVDVICHGIPSADTFAAYKRVMEKKYGAPVTSVRYRAKDKGWHMSGMKLTFANGKCYREHTTVDAYCKGMIYDITLKESCYNCPFRTYKSGSDLTLGDFWGLERVPALKAADDNKGMSAVLAHTEKGRALLNSLPVTLTPVPLSAVEAGNRCLLTSPPVNPVRAAYYECAAAEGEEAAIEKYLTEKPAERRKRLLRYNLRRVKHFLTGKKTYY